LGRAVPAGPPLTALTEAPSRFVPPRAPAASPPPPPAPAIAVVVLSRAADLPAATGSVAAGLRRRGHTPVACIWDPEGAVDPEDGPDAVSGPLALPAATRAARRLAAHGLAATARGAVAWVALDADASAAHAQVRRVERVASGPVVVGLAARHPLVDPLVAEAGRVAVALPDDCMPGIAEFALAEARTLNAAVERVTPPAGVIARTEARLGLR
jgi:hypothetical protein